VVTQRIIGWEVGAYAVENLTADAAVLSAAGLQRIANAYVAYTCARGRI
jgi:hypothetical protein